MRNPQFYASGKRPIVPINATEKAIDPSDDDEAVSVSIFRVSVLGCSSTDWECEARPADGFGNDNVTTTPKLGFDVENSLWLLFCQRDGMVQSFQRARGAIRTYL